MCFLNSEPFPLNKKQQRLDHREGKNLGKGKAFEKGKVEREKVRCKCPGLSCGAETSRGV